MKTQKALVGMTLAATVLLAIVPATSSATTAKAVCSRARTSSLPTPAVTLGVAGAYRYKGRDYSAAGERLRFYGRINGASLGGDPLAVKVFVGGRQVRSSTVTPTSQGCSSAVFSYKTNIWKSGKITWKVEHAASGLADAFSKSAGGPTVYRLASGFGSRGTGVSILLAMLRGKGYYAPHGSNYGAGTGKAVLAFRKVNRMSRIETPSQRIYHLLQIGQGGIHALYPTLGEHLEADLSKQVLTFYKGSKALEIHPISSGKPSTPTVLGKYRFYMREPGTNGHGMVYSSYFHNGYAVHGYVELPTYAASHGCLRTWVPSAVHIYNRIKLGEWIAVFG